MSQEKRKQCILRSQKAWKETTPEQKAAWDAWAAKAEQHLKDVGYQRPSEKRQPQSRSE